MLQVYCAEIQSESTLASPAAAPADFFAMPEATLYRSAYDSGVFLVISGGGGGFHCLPRIALRDLLQCKYAIGPRRFTEANAHGCRYLGTVTRYHGVCAGVV
jgi:hypothetical protein